LCKYNLNLFGDLVAGRGRGRGRGRGQNRGRGRGDFRANGGPIHAGNGNGGA